MIDAEPQQRVTRTRVIGGKFLEFGDLRSPLWIRRVLVRAHEGQLVGPVTSPSYGAFSCPGICWRLAGSPFRRRLSPDRAAFLAHQLIRALHHLHHRVIIGLLIAGLKGPLVLPAATLEANKLSTIVSLVASGLGVSLVPMPLPRLGLWRVVCTPLVAPRPEIPLAIAWRGGDRNPVLGPLLETVRKEAQRRPRWTSWTLLWCAGHDAGLGRMAERGPAPSVRRATVGSDSLPIFRRETRPVC